MNTIIADLSLRNETPTALRVSLMVLLLVLAILYSINTSWFTALKILAAAPIQRFGWQSEKYGVNYLLRISSLLGIALTLSIFIYTYRLGYFVNDDALGINFFLKAFGIVLLLTLTKFIANKFYFYLHKLDQIGDRIIDFQYSLGQLVFLLIGALLLIDIFYTRLHSGVFILLIIIFITYFLIRLYGTILLLQNNFKYPIITLFVYLCTFEIVPALVSAKVLFVHS